MHANDSPTPPQDDPTAPRTRGTSRRRFLQGGAIGVAGAALGGIAGYAWGARTEEDAFAPAPADPASAFDHLIVLMGENRSFDNLLGLLYDRDTLPSGSRFNGLAFGTYANVTPDGRRVPAHVYTGTTDEVMGMPAPDPGEEYPHVNTQLWGEVLPASNATRGVEEMTSPYNLPPHPGVPTMSGFITDYVNTATREVGSPPPPEVVDQIMGGFSPDMLPVLSTLAREFAVFDNWYAAVPTQTYANRSFFHASTSHGFVTNHGGGYRKWLDTDPAPTIFNRLEEAGLSWRIYFDEDQLLSLTGFLHAPVLEKYWKTQHFAVMSDFYADVANGTLPAYAFIEPRMIYNHNDFHPPFGEYRTAQADDTTLVDSAVSDVRAGEALVADVYNAVRTAASTTGSHARNTALLITFDEHGGTYDHVPPPAAVPPDHREDTEMDFGFDRLGLRVPAILVSAYTAAGTIVNDELHHAAVIATLCHQHGLAPLTDRDADARDLRVALNLSSPRDPATWPSVTPMWTPPNPDATLDRATMKSSKTALTPPARGLLGLLMAREGLGDGRAPRTYADAFALLEEHGHGLFGER
ncbi:alkaline phosphatase family protein [Microbacterium gorillae]|uniref:alkaline phosphatase family protein n=1 Tax=Microbacterium gorillae TaxID=1231063 RepID=UPI003D97EA89